MSCSAQRDLPARENTPWLGQFHHLFAPGMRVLDLGCGTGDDTREITALGCEAIALDFSRDRVRQVPAACARLRVVGDVVGRLPFAANSFDIVVASLSLHYFTSAGTDRAISEVARTLQGEGWLICRVNAIGDTNFGYGQGPEVEPSVFRHDEGHLKRFFDEPMLRRFLEPCFRLCKITPRTILQRGLEKRTLECLARKR
jgi:ubiquinone/menaquinone biosynthesis C-methylase UbiE